VADRDRIHLLIPGRAESEPYRRSPRNISGRPYPVPANRRQHGQQLEAQLRAASDEGISRREAAGIDVAGRIDGVYLKFEGFPDMELALESLDPRRGRSRPELRAVREDIVDGQPVQIATVFVPDGQLGYFLSRLEQYISTAETDRPRQRALLDRINAVGLAGLEELWTDPRRDFPQTADAVWWEVWLRRRDGHEFDRLRSFAERAGAEVRAHTLAFPDRLVALVRATREQLSTAVEVLDDIAELRAPREPAELLALEPAAEQADWVDDLAARTYPAPPSAPAACVVDTGVHQSHPLLAGSLGAADCHTCDPAWGSEDRDGHGTEMAGLALYGDLGTAVLSGLEVRLRHRLESVKLLPRPHVNPPELWGALTADATSRVEVQEPRRRRAFCVTSTAVGDPIPPGTEHRIVVGQPSSWSAAIDALAAGFSIATSEEGMVFLDEGDTASRRLFLLSAGNVSAWEDGYLTRCDLEPIEDPAQAWNAVTVGAFTELVHIDPGERGYDGWTPLAEAGELSPFSRTSVAFDRQWPIKPDVVMDGGNLARSPAGTELHHPITLQLLTTKAPIRDQRLLTVTNATSAATAQAAQLAASILAEYPRLWPETVRALIVHSAEWTPAMLRQFAAAAGRQGTMARFRRYGMGVPNLARATRSATDALTLMAEDVIHPYDGHGRMREMNLHELPWPIDELAAFGESDVRLRITLSYFIQPNPARRGWQRRYRYASHGLRFEVRRPTESTDDFRKRVNHLALEEEERRPRTQSDAAQWWFGPDQRTAGSLHTDIWTGTAADLAQRGVIAVFPVAGWWKERPDRDRSELGVRYSLVVSIETPGQDVDIWTPVATEIGVPVVIET